MLLWPGIEERARDMGATPAELSVALTIGTARCLLAASPQEDRGEASRAASTLFATALASLQGDQ